jgi:hypothetical protein
VDAAAVLAGLPPWERTSNEDAAAHAVIKLDALGCRHRRAVSGESAPAIRLAPDQLECLAHMEHNRWMAERLVAGWRHGPRDDQCRRRPSLCAWENLHDTTERAKDVSQIRAMIRAFNTAGRVLEPVAGGESVLPARNARTVAETSGAPTDDRAPGSIPPASRGPRG